MIEHSPITTFSVLSGVLSEEGSSDEGTLRKHMVDVLFFGHSDGVVTAIFENNFVKNDVVLSEERVTEVWCGRMHTESICGVIGVPGENMFVSWSKHEVKIGVFDVSNEGVSQRMDLSHHAKGHSIVSILVIERNLHLFTKTGKVLEIDIDGNLIKQFELVVNNALSVEQVVCWGDIDEYYVLWDGNRISKHKHHDDGKFSQLKFSSGGKISSIDISSDQRTLIASICTAKDWRASVFDMSRLMTANFFTILMSYTTESMQTESGPELNHVIGVHHGEDQNYCFATSNAITYASTHHDSKVTFTIPIIQRVFKITDKKFAYMKWSTDSTRCFLVGKLGSIIVFHTSSHSPEISLATAVCIPFPIHKKYLEQKMKLFNFCETEYLTDVQIVTHLSSYNSSEPETKYSILAQSSFDIFHTGKSDKSVARYIFGHEDGTFSMFAKETSSGPCTPLCCFQPIHSSKIVGFLKVSDNRYLSWTRKEIFISDQFFQVVKDLSLHIKGETVIALEYYGTSVYVVTHMAKLKIVELRSDFKFIKCKEISLVTEGLSGLTVKSCQITFNTIKQIELLILWNNERDFSLRVLENNLERIQNVDAPINISLYNRISELGKTSRFFYVKYMGEHDYTFLTKSSIPETLEKSPEFPKVPDYTIYYNSVFNTKYGLTSDKFYSLLDNVRLEITAHDLRRAFKGFNEKFVTLRWCKNFLENSALYLICSGGTVIVFDLDKDEFHAPNLKYCKLVRMRCEESSKKIILNKSVRVPKVANKK